MAKRKPAMLSDGRRAPSASASRARPGARGTEPKGQAAAPTGKGARLKPTGGPIISRENTPAKPAKPGRADRSGKPSDEVVAKGRTTGAMPRGSEKAPAGNPKAGPPSAAAKARQPLFARTANEEGPSPAVPSSLNLNRRASAARTGRAELQQRFREHHETGPEIAAGDIDADWASAYTVGDEAPGGDNPTPGQTVVDDVGRALGVEYEDAEELKAVDKIETRDRHRWELDPASSEDYPERTKETTGKRKQK